MSKLTPNEIGALGEKLIGRYFQGLQVSQSGGGKFWKLDRAAGLLLISVKATTKRSMTITANMLAEARRAARGGLGRGDKYNPALAIIIEGESEPWIAFPASFVAELLTKPAEMAYIEPSKAAQRQARVDASRLG